jgi:hypothetical protein
MSPMSRRWELVWEGKESVKVLLLALVGLVIVALLWFSPSYIHAARTWYRLYSVCVAEAPPAGTLGDVMTTRSGCARLARQLSR